MYVAQGFCHDCDEFVKIEKRGLNHILHIILSIFTMGLWVVVYIFLAIASLGGWGWKCSKCGGDNVDKKI